MELIGGMFALLGLILAGLIWFLPILLIAMSDRTGGKEKLAWVLAVVFITWFAWIFYMLFAPLKKAERYGYYR